jgi:ATP-dependent RNA helicase RhlE
VRALILAPTRELANQIGDNMRNFVKRTPLRIVTVVGGASINTQTRNLERGADILIATPGRLLDLSERGAVRIGTASYLVLDEADQMLDLGFIHALRKIAAMVGAPRQTLLFSATMPKAIEQLSRTFLVDPVRVETASPGKPAEKVSQSVHFVQQARKADLLKELLLRDPAHLSLVFARTKHGTEKLMKNLVAAGIDAVSIHGNKSQSQRERAIRQFREGEARVLVATDVAARGIDIPGVSHVYNHDLPEVPEAYVHRIGRTARAGASGEAVSLCAPDENHLLRAVEKLTGIAIHRVNAPAAQANTAAADGPREQRREDRNRPRNGRGKRRPQASASGKPRDAEIAHVRVSEGKFQRRGEAQAARPAAPEHAKGTNRNGAHARGNPSNGGHGKPGHAHANAHGRHASGGNTGSGHNKDAGAGNRPANGRPQRPHRQNRRPERAATY